MKYCLDAVQQESQFVAPINIVLTLHKRGKRTEVLNDLGKGIIPVFQDKGSHDDLVGT